MVEHQPSKLDTWVRFPSPAYKNLRFQPEAFFVSSRDLEPMGSGLGEWGLASVVAKQVPPAPSDPSPARKISG